MAQPGKPPTMFCLECGYVLDGLGGTQCPECGRAFDPRDGSTFRRGLDDAVRLCFAPSPSEARRVRQHLEEAGIDSVVDEQEVRVHGADIDRADQRIREPVDAMRCPCCSVPMTPGYIWVDQRGGSLVPSALVWAAGVPEHRTFAGYVRDDVIIVAAMRRAHRCPDCARLLIEPAPEIEIEDRFRGADHYVVECLSCGEQMPPGSTECAMCGWSYEEGDEVDRE